MVVVNCCNCCIDVSLLLRMLRMLRIAFALSLPSGLLSVLFEPAVSLKVASSAAVVAFHASTFVYLVTVVVVFAALLIVFTFSSIWLLLKAFSGY